MSELAQELIQEQQRLAAARAPWEGLWRDIAERCCPWMAGFDALGGPARRASKSFDSTAGLAAENFAAAIMGMIIPREHKWHGLRSGVAEVDRSHAVQVYFEEVRDLLFYHRYAPRANFDNQFYEVVMSLGLFGTGCLWVDEIVGEGLLYRAVHLSEVYIEENAHGRVETVHRRARMTARQWRRRWGDDALPRSVAEALKDGHGHREFEYLHVLRPRADFDAQALDARALPVESIVVAVADRKVVSRGGFRSMPLLVSRYTAGPSETYGRSPAMQALPNVRMTDEMTRTLLNAAQRAVSPPLLVADDGVLSALSVVPNAINVGGLDMAGRPRVQPLHTGGSIPVGLEMVAEAQRRIEKAFLVPLFSILSDTPDRMTATEVLERAKEKGVLLSPAAGKIEAEVLGLMIEREMDILAASGRLPPLPPELEAAPDYRITYDNPLQRAAMAEGSIGFLRTVEALGPVAQMRPEVYNEIDFTAAARGLAAANGMPASWLRDPAERQAEKAERAEREQTAQILEGARLAGDAAQSLSALQDAAGAA